MMPRIVNFYALVVVPSASPASRDQGSKIFLSFEHIYLFERRIHAPINFAPGTTNDHTIHQ